MNTLKKVATVILAVVLFASAFSLTASASTQTIELTTRSALLIDRSGSIEDQEKVNEILENIYQPQFDFVGYFDNRQISLDPTYLGGSNSAICETVDEVAKLGYTHITVITDGQQWPKDYSSLGVYSDLDLTLIFVGDKEEDSEELINNLKGRMINSNLKVVTPEGENQVILDEYQAPVYEIDLSDNSEGGDNTTIISDSCCNGDCCKCKHLTWSWWWLLLLLIPLLGLLLWWLFRNWRIARKIKHSHAVVDCSNSMAKVLTRLYRACRRLGVSAHAEIVRFGQGASVEKLDFLKNVQGEGSTQGTEGLQLAIDQGWEEIVLVSDLGFNGQAVSSLNGRFKKVSVVAPEGYSSATLDEIRKIADEVEVLHL